MGSSKRGLQNNISLLNLRNESKYLYVFLILSLHYKMHPDFSVYLWM